MNISEIAAEAPLSVLKDIGIFIESKTDYKIIAEPSFAMIHLKHRDPLEDTPFYMGEVFVTRCEVEVSGSLGFGCVQGKDEKRALLAALLDGVQRTDHEWKKRLNEMLKEALDIINEGRRKHQELVNKTKVDFEIMNEG